MKLDFKETNALRAMIDNTASPEQVAVLKAAIADDIPVLDYANAHQLTEMEYHLLTVVSYNLGRVMTPDEVDQAYNLMTEDRTRRIEIMDDNDIDGFVEDIAAQIGDDDRIEQGLTPSTGPGPSVLGSQH